MWPLNQYHKGGMLSKSIEATEESTILIGHALPFNKPIVAQGPFVMNTENEIEQAYQDYREGKFGVWKNWKY